MSRPNKFSGIVCWLLGAVACSTSSELTALDPLDDRAQFPGGSTTNTLLTGVNAFNQPVENLSDEHRAEFFSGNSLFNSSWVEAPSSTEARDGLGPLFNARSCSACHLRDGRGRPPLAPDDDEAFGLLFRLRTGFDKHGEPKPDPTYGGQFQPLSLPDLSAEGSMVVTWKKHPVQLTDGTEVELRRPVFAVDSLKWGELDEATAISPRLAPQMIGVGLLEAISEERLLELADEDDADRDQISGRVRWAVEVESGERRPGRFGWKAEQPSVRQQVAGAFNGDMGITSSLFPEHACPGQDEACQTAKSGGEPEIDDLLLTHVERYSQLLAVPARRDFHDQVTEHGAELFGQVGCANCHVPHHRTGVHPDLPELSEQDIWPYTDLLLHDLGEDLADGELELDREWRTAPLWGIGLVQEVNDHQRLMHDGRADGVEEAILWHGGEAKQAQQAFMDLDAAERKALIEFVNSL